MTKPLYRRAAKQRRVSVPEPEPAPDLSAMRPADAIFRSVKKHGHRTLALRAAARMEARALEAGPQTTTEPPPPTPPAVDVKPPAPVETKPATPPPEPDQRTLWREELSWWRPLSERDPHEYTRKGYDPFEDSR